MPREAQDFGEPVIPPWPGEDHVCPACGTSYAVLSPDDVGARIRAAVAQLPATVGRCPAPRRRERPSDGVWSVNEYVWHLRDVSMSSTIRLHRIRVEDRPVLEPMYNDLRARRFGYRERDAALALDEVAAAAEGFLAELARTDDWARTGARLAGEERTALWVARNAAHEAVHHLADITTLTAEVE